MRSLAEAIIASQQPMKAAMKRVPGMKTKRNGEA